MANRNDSASPYPAIEIAATAVQMSNETATTAIVNAARIGVAITKAQGGASSR